MRLWLAEKENVSWSVLERLVRAGVYPLVFPNGTYFVKADIGGIISSMDIRSGPEAPFFLETDNGEVTFTLNGELFPNRKWLLGCKKVIENLLEYSDEEVRQINERKRMLLKKEIQGGTPKIRTEVNGFVYIIKSNKKYKIGRTRNLDDRIKSYRTQNPFDINVIFSKAVDSPVRSEKRLLEFFKEKRIVGTTEWYSLNKKELSTLIDFANSEL